MRPNVVLIVLDTARADAFQPFGAPPGDALTVRQLADAGIATTPVAPSSWTLPSHAAMFTGRLPRALGLDQAPGGSPAGARPVLERHRDVLLPAVFAADGYATAAVSANLWIGEESGFATGFHRFRSVRGTRPTHGSGVLDRARWGLSGVLARHDDGAEEAMSLLGSWLASPDLQQPFLWFVNINECHSPYLPPRPHNDLPPWQRLRAADEARRHLNLASIWRTCLTDRTVPADALERMRHLYRRSVQQADAWLAWLLQQLHERAILDDTLVVVTSDHGENLGEAGLIGHSFSLDDRLIRVPLVAAGPGADRLAGLRSLTGLPAALASAAVLAHHPWGSSDRAPVSQLGALMHPDDPRVAETARDWELDDRGVRLLTEPLTSASDDRWKVVRHGSQAHAFDLARDPMEVDPLAVDRAPRALRRMLEQPEVWETAASGPGTAGATERDADLEERMRTLGYL